MVYRAPVVSLRRLREADYEISPEIGRTAQCAKDIPDVVCGRNTFAESPLPTLKDTLHDPDPRRIDILDGRLEPSLVRPEEVLRRRLTGVRPIEIARGAHDDHPRVIHALVHRAAEERLQASVVLLRGRAVDRAAVREERRRIRERLGQERAGVIHVRRRDVARDDARHARARGVTRGRRILRAVRDGGRRVRQVRGLREGDSLRIAPVSLINASARYL